MLLRVVAFSTMLPFLRLLLFLSLALCLHLPYSSHLTYVTGQTLTPKAAYPRMGGLPKLYPPRPRVDCTTLADDCGTCTSEPACAFCYTGVSTDGLNGQQKLLGSCTYFDDPLETKKCPGANRFYVTGQCDEPILKPGCTIQVDGSCQIVYPYHEFRANHSQLDFGRGWFIFCVIFLGVMLAYTFFAPKPLVPAPGTRDNGDNDDRTICVLLMRVLCCTCSLAAVATNKWSKTWEPPPNDDITVYYGLWGTWINEMHNSFYTCDSAFKEPSASLATCQALKGSVILVAILQLVAVCLFFLVPSITLCGARIDTGATPRWRRMATFFWRLDMAAMVCTVMSMALWAGTAHTILAETMVLPQYGGPAYSLSLWHSFRLTVCTCLFSLILVAVQGVIVNNLSPADPEPPKVIEMVVAEKELDGIPNSRGVPEGEEKPRENDSSDDEDDKKEGDATDEPISAPVNLFPDTTKPKIFDDDQVEGAAGGGSSANVLAARSSQVSPPLNEIVVLPADPGAVYINPNIPPPSAAASDAATIYSHVPLTPASSTSHPVTIHTNMDHGGPSSSAAAPLSVSEMLEANRRQAEEILALQRQRDAAWTEPTASNGEDSSSSIPNQASL